MLPEFAEREGRMSDEWTKIAQALLAKLSTDFSEMQRGVLLSAFACPGATDKRYCVAFGNDDYEQDSATKVEVEGFRTWLREMKCQERIFLKSRDGHSWILLFEIPHESEEGFDEVLCSEANGALWESWRISHDVAEEDVRSEASENYKATAACEKLIARLKRTAR